MSDRQTLNKIFDYIFYKGLMVGRSTGPRQRGGQPTSLYRTDVMLTQLKLIVEGGYRATRAKAVINQIISNLQNARRVDQPSDSEPIYDILAMALTNPPDEQFRFLSPFATYEVTYYEFRGRYYAAPGMMTDDNLQLLTGQQLYAALTLWLGYTIGPDAAINPVNPDLGVNVENPPTEVTLQLVMTATNRPKTKSARTDWGGGGGGAITPLQKTNNPAPTNKDKNVQEEVKKELSEDQINEQIATIMQEELYDQLVEEVTSGELQGIYFQYVLEAIIDNPPVIVDVEPLRTQVDRVGLPRMLVAASDGFGVDVPDFEFPQDNQIARQSSSFDDALRGYINAETKADVNFYGDILKRMISQKVSPYLNNFEVDVLKQIIRELLNVPRGIQNVFDVYNILTFINDPRPVADLLNEFIQSAITRCKDLALTLAISGFPYSAIFGYLGILFNKLGIISQPEIVPVTVTIQDIMLDVSQQFDVTVDNTFIISSQRAKIYPFSLSSQSFSDLLKGDQYIIRDEVVIVEDYTDNIYYGVDNQYTDNIYYGVNNEYSVDNEYSSADSPLLTDLIKPLPPQVVRQINYGVPILQKQEVVRPPFDYELFQQIDEVLQQITGQPKSLDSHEPTYLPNPGFGRFSFEYAEFLNNHEKYIKTRELSVFAESYKQTLIVNKVTLQNFIDQPRWGGPSNPTDDDADDDDVGSDSSDFDKLKNTKKGQWFILKTLIYWILNPIKHLIANLKSAIEFSTFIAASIMSALGFSGWLIFNYAMSTKEEFTKLVLSIKDGVNIIAEQAGKTLVNVAEQTGKTLVNVAESVQSTSSAIKNVIGTIDNISQSVFSFSSSGIGVIVILGLVGALAYGLTRGGLKFSIF